MKIQIQTPVVLTISDKETCGVALRILMNCSYDSVVCLTALLECYPDFDIATALTTVVHGSPHEHVVKCVQYSRYDQLDWIFDRKLVSPDFISENGSPLILFAMQNSLKMLQYFISRGAQVLRDGDFVTNHTDTEITALFVARGRTQVQKALLGIVVVNLGDISSMDTLVGFHKIATELQLWDIVNRISCRIAALGGSHLVNVDRTAWIMRLVAQKCNVALSYKEAGKGLSEMEIRSAMITALSEVSFDAYAALRMAFPSVIIM